MQVAADSRKSDSVPKRSGYLPTLDGWRAVAVAMVLLNHAGLPPMHHVGFISGLGSLGVDLFFAISGLLICSRLLEEERTTGRISLRGFYVRRTFRIFPPAYLFLGVVALLMLLRVLPAGWWAWSSAIVFLRNYFTAFAGETVAGRITGHFWSLAVEEHFYLLLPGLLVLFPRHRKTVLTGLIFAVLAWVVFYMRHIPPVQRQLYWERRSDLRLNSLLLPALLALWLANSAIRTRFARIITPATVGTLLVVMTVSGIAVKKLLPHPHPAVAVQNTVAINAEAGNDPPMEAVRPLKDSRFFLLTIYVVPVLFPFVILATMLHPGALVSRWLEWQPLRAVGRISYSLYLWQQLFWVPIRNVTWPINAVQSHWVGLPLTFLCAIASYYLVEKPAIRLGHRLAPPATPGHADLAGEAEPQPSTTVPDAAS